jgi:PhnB protein
MWGQVDSDNGLGVMAYDVPAGTPWNQGKNGYFVSLRGDAAEEIAAHWKKLSKASTIIHHPAAGAGSVEPALRNAEGQVRRRLGS